MDKVFVVFQEVLEGDATSVGVFAIFADESRAKACADRKFNRWMEEKRVILDLPKAAFEAVAE